jgi:hypothetical protein
MTVIRDVLSDLGTVPPVRCPPIGDVDLNAALDGAFAILAELERRGNPEERRTVNDAALKQVVIVVLCVRQQAGDELISQMVEQILNNYSIQTKLSHLAEEAARYADMAERATENIAPSHYTSRLMLGHVAVAGAILVGAGCFVPMAGSLAEAALTNVLAVAGLVIALVALLIRR